MSRNGTASTTSGPTSAINAFVFSVPSTITAPSSSPSRFDPQSPMNTDAGWKLKIRKPSAAPQVIAARMPAVRRPRSKAMIANATAEIAHTPAASPSTPSQKFTMFISSTSANTVSGPPKSPSSTRCTNGNVNVSTLTPLVTSTTAATICPASLTAGCRSKMSSSAPTIVISAAAARIPSVRWLSGRNISPATSAPPKIARPPSSGVASRASPLLLQLVDRADAAREARRERCERRRHGEGDQRGEDGLRHHDCGARIAGPPDSDDVKTC